MSHRGGTAFATFRSFVADKHIKIYHDSLPHDLTDVFGMTYNQYTRPVNVTVDGSEAEYWMELLQPTTAIPVVNYTHRYWDKYAAVTKNNYEKGTAWYIGTMLPGEKLKKYLLEAIQDAGIDKQPQCWPIIIRNGISKERKQLHFILNYSDQNTDVTIECDGRELLTDKCYKKNEKISLMDWGVAVIEEE